MANKDEVIQHFIELTGVDVEVANFYLDSSNWDIETALSSYYANDGEDEEPEALPESSPANVIQTDITNESANNVNMATETSKPKKQYNEKSNIATLSSIKQLDSESDDDEKHGQAFYVGGSEHGGGQQILGPPKDGKKSRHQDLKSLFKSAQRHGAEVVAHEEEVDADSSKPFSGSGYRLGESTSESTGVAAPKPAATTNKPVKVNVKIWSNGFSVNDGPLRSLSDPSNAQFLQSLSVGRIPVELLQEHHYAKIDLSMEDHSGEEFREAARARMVPFQGSGHMLGSPVPAIAISTAGITGTPLITGPAVVVNEKEPVTQVQVRLADNSRMVARLNYHHTVGDVRASIVSQHPQYRSAAFTLMTAFPNKLLTDDSLSLQDGNLLNSVLIQRLL